jgi:dipeptidyl aminopeptidase/acylaminoacyl peptidase
MWGVWRKHMKTLYAFPQWDLPVSSVSPLDTVRQVSTSARVRLLVGDKDQTAVPESSRNYADALKRRGVDAEVTILPGRDHEILLDPAVIEALRRLLSR